MVGVICKYYKELEYNHVVLFEMRGSSSGTFDHDFSSVSLQFTLQAYISELDLGLNIFVKNFTISVSERH